MATSTTSSSGGVGFAGLLTLLFIGLKLGGIIQWSWLWVLAPLWIGLAITIGIIIIISICMLIGFVIKLIHENA